VTCAAVTRTIRVIPTEVPLDTRDGLREDSVINCDELFTISKDRLVRRIGVLSPARLQQFHRALRFALAVPRDE
jgi:mRNA-degrading endonuclease toxin of MazEF toxin-antitoxin module